MKKPAPGSSSERFRRQTGDIAYCHLNKGWNTVIRKQGYPNGIFVETTQSLYMVQFYQKKSTIMRLLLPGKVDLTSKKARRKSSWDEPDGDAGLLDDFILCVFKFMKHGKNKEKHSPSLAYRIDPNTLEAELVYQNNGEEISGVNGAVA